MEPGPGIGVRVGVISLRSNIIFACINCGFHPFILGILRSQNMESSICSIVGKCNPDLKLQVIHVRLHSRDSVMAKSLLLTMMNPPNVTIPQLMFVNS